MNKITEGMFYGINATSVERYLQLKGWERDYSFKNPYLHKFFDKKTSKHIVISASEKYQDFYRTLESALQTVSVLLKKSIEDIIKEISNVYFDKMEFRIISKLSEDGKLPLKYASDCIEGLKELILYAACAEQNAQPICFRTTNLAKNYLDNFKLAQTEIGSFIINIDIQVVDDEYEQLTLDECVPTPTNEHRIVERIFNAMSQVDNMVEYEQEITEVAKEAYLTGITANMCEALLKMKPEKGEAKISATLKQAAILNNSSKNICIGNNHFYVIDELAKTYRNNVLVEDVTLKGVIKSLTKKDNEATTEKIIRLLTQYDGKYRVVFMELSDEEHLLACNAYRDDLEVEVSGELDMSNRNWILSNISNFQIS